MNYFKLSLLIASAGLATLMPDYAAVELTDIHSVSGGFYPVDHRAIYMTKVRVDDPEMKLTCEWLAADLPHGTNTDRRIFATNNVVIDLATGTNQNWHVTCDQAVYVFHVQGAVTNETVTLTGRARALSDQVTVTGEPLVYNLVTKLFSGTNYETEFSHNFINFNGTNSAAKTNRVTVPQ